MGRSAWRAGSDRCWSLISTDCLVCHTKAFGPLPESNFLTEDFRQGSEITEYVF